MAYFPRGGVSSVPVTGVIKSSFTPCKLVRQPGPVFRAVLPKHEKNILIFQSFPNTCRRLLNSYAQFLDALSFFPLNFLVLPVRHPFKVVASIPPVTGRKDMPVTQSIKFSLGLNSGVSYLDGYFKRVAELPRKLRLRQFCSPR